MPGLAGCKQVLDKTERAFEDLRLLAGLVERIERERFQTPHLRALVEKLRSHDVRCCDRDCQACNRRAAGRVASQSAVAGARGAAHVFGARRTCSGALAACARRGGARLARCRSVRSRRSCHWRRIATSILTIHFRSSSTVRRALSGESLGHPLIPAARCVRNDVSIEGQCARSCWSAVRTCLVRVRCCEPWGSIPCSPWRARPVRAAAFQTYAAAGRCQHPHQRFIA